MPVFSWPNPFNLSEQPSEATLSLIANNISSGHSNIQSITLTILSPLFFQSVSSVESQGLFEQGEHAVGNFLEGWTRRVGDPVISKWIVIILCVSMGLNAWLLNAVSRGAMQPLQTSNKSADIDSKPSIPERSTMISQTEPPKLGTPFVLNDSENDDEEKHISAVKKISRRVRSLAECVQILSEGRAADLLDEELIALTVQKKISLYALEKTLNDFERAVKIRRAVVCILSVTE
jgi:hydroxymethylglutaryl-CoA reductase (NADPH)